MTIKADNAPVKSLTLNAEGKKEVSVPTDKKTVMAYLGSIEMNPEMAAVALSWSRNAVTYLRTGVQKQVNQDFHSEIPNALKGLDVDGSPLKLSVQTRQSFEKLDKALGRAANTALDIQTVQDESKKLS